jgi:hypothetical protein
MGIQVQTLALSTLNPVEVSYKYNSTEALNGAYRLYSNGLQTHNYDVFKNFHDAAISKQTAVVLTSIKDLKNVFLQTLKKENIGNISGNCYLQTSNTPLLNGDVFVKLYQNELWIGGKGEPAVFTIVPIESNVVELKVKDLYVQVSESYPYDLTLSKTSLPSYELHRQKFQIEFVGELILFKHLTSDSTYRSLSFSIADRKLRCTGLQLNQAIINQYLFLPTFVSQTQLTRGFDPSTLEVRYYNFVDSGVKQKNADVYQKIQTNTNLLVTIPTHNLLSENASANISILKTNYSTTGTFLNTLQ